MYWKLNNNTLSLTDEITDYPKNNYSDNAEEINDLITLIHLHQPALLNVLMKRYNNNIIYTNINHILLAVNPFKKINYSIKQPCPEKIAETCLKINRNHTILINGESGAGKTETSKILLNFITKNNKDNELGNKILSTNIILESLLKWFAPILVFTTEEIYSLVNKKNESIHENNFVKIPSNWKNDKLNEKWSNLFKIKQEINIAIEEKRTSKEIGSSLEAEIKLSINKEKFELLNDIDLAEYFIVSKAEKKLSEQDRIEIEVSKAKGSKCERCWKILENKCERCSNLAGSKL